MTATSTTPARSPVLRRAVVYRPESAVFWVYVAAVGFGALSLLAGEGAAMREALAANLVLSPLWICFVAAVVWLLLRFDPFRAMRSYPQVLAAATAIGGTAAVSMAITGNTALQRLWALVLSAETLTQWSAALTAPVIEESAKALCAAVLLVLGAGVFTRIAHALLIGMFVGFGFDLMEDLGYTTRTAITDLDSDLAGAGGQLAVRMFTTVPAHWSYTSLTAVGVLLLLPGFSGRAEWPAGRRRAVAVGLLLSGPLMHFVWNSPLPDTWTLLALLGKVVLTLAFYLAIVLWLLRFERRWVGDRIAAGAVADFPPALVESLLTRSRRRALRRAARQAGGRAAQRQVAADQCRALDRIQND